MRFSNDKGQRSFASINRECLNHFIAFGEAHLRYLIDEYVNWYNTVRPHQGLVNKPLALADIPEEDEPQPLSRAICDERRGGLLRHYQRAA